MAASRTGLPLLATRCRQPAPSRAGLQTFHAAVAPRRHVTDLIQVRALCHDNRSYPISPELNLYDGRIWTLFFIASGSEQSGRKRAMLETKVATTAVIDDYDEIARVVQLYIDGNGRGEVEKLKDAFDGEARMYGHVDGHRFDVPVGQFFQMAASQPAGAGGQYRARITSVQQVGDAAVATVAEDGCWGSVSFVDFLSLVRIDGVWKIVNKAFAHTGGKMPA